MEAFLMTSLEEYNGPELKDYSGELLFGLNTDQTAKKFSKQVLARIIEAGGLLYTGIDGMYTEACNLRWDIEAALNLDAELWRRYAHADVRRVMEALNIRGNDVETLFKCYQCMPGIIAKMPEVEYELKDKNHGILTVRHCRSLNYCVRHGMSSLQVHLCETLDVEGFETTAHHVNPEIKVTQLKSPKHLRVAEDLWKKENVTEPERCSAMARELQKETDWPGLASIACQWEFKLG